MTTTVLITGANKGLGRETARRLALQGWNVVLGARDVERGNQALKELADEGLTNVEFLEIDVTSEESVAAAAVTFARDHDHLDVLINNAGAGGQRLHPSETPAAEFGAIYETNVFGVARVTHTFLPLLQKAHNPRIVMVSSSLGSFHTMTAQDGGGYESTLLQLVYPSSKAALNMLVTQYAKAFPDININAANPGFTATDLNHNTGRQTVTEGTDAIVNLASIGPDGPTGGFFDRNGPIPW